MTVDALSQVIPSTAITQVIAQEGVGEIRERRLTAVLTVWLVIGLHLFPTVAISGVFCKLVRGVRLLWPDPAVPLPSDRALAYRRQHLSARALVALCKQVCRPIATPQTRRAQPPASCCIWPGLFVTLVTALVGDVGFVGDEQQRLVVAGHDVPEPG